MDGSRAGAHQVGRSGLRALLISPHCARNSEGGHGSRTGGCRAARALLNSRFDVEPPRRADRAPSATTGSESCTTTAESCCSATTAAEACCASTGTRRRGKRRPARGFRSRPGRFSWRRFCFQRKAGRKTRGCAGKGGCRGRSCSGCKARGEARCRLRSSPRRRRHRSKARMRTQHSAIYSMNSRKTLSRLPAPVMPKIPTRTTTSA